MGKISVGEGTPGSSKANLAVVTKFHADLIRNAL